MTRLRLTAALLLIVCLVTGCPRPGSVDATTGSTSTSTTATGSGATDTGCQSPAPGDLWGPCTPDKHCAGEESGLFGCMFVPNPDAPQGSLCAPLCTIAGACEQADEAVVCGEALGSPACEITGACALVCTTDADCGAGLGCFGTRCLWVE